MTSTHILAVGRIEHGGDIEMDISLGTVAIGDLLPWVDPHDSIELQRLIDEAADTDEYEDDIEDRNIWRRGGW